MKYILTGLCTLILCIATAKFGGPSNNGFYVTGAPSEATCIGCHFNTESTSEINIEVLNKTYTGIDLRIAVYDTTAINFGVQLTAVGQDGKSHGVFAHKDGFRVTTNLERAYMEHTSPLLFDSTGVVSFDITWLGDTSADFYIATVLGNFDLIPENDSVLLHKYTTYNKQSTPTILYTWPYILITNEDVLKKVELWNMQGRLYHETPLTNETTLYMDRFPAGLYILKLQTNTETIIKKIWRH